MPIDATSTLADARAAYLDNVGYAAAGSAAMAAAFAAACRALLLLQPTAAGSGPGKTVAFDVAALRAELLRADRWAAARGAGCGGTRAFDLRGLRD